MLLDGLGARISANIYKPFHAEQAPIIADVQRIVRNSADNVMNAAPFLDIFVFIDSYDFGDVKHDVFGFIYENYLKELYSDQQLGQFFTDPAVVDFMLDEVGYTPEGIRARGRQRISLVDPSCGSGTFLYSALRALMDGQLTDSLETSQQIEADILENIFGLDIAAFPLYLAEMSILMQMLPIIVAETYNNPIDKKLRLFVTEDSVAEFLDDVGKRVSRVTGTKKQFSFAYAGFMRDDHDLREMKASLNVQGSGKSATPCANVT
jgi:N-6 DNA Methylase